ncbi:hypothetical protein [Aquimarina sp. 2201CG5-10]|uniref:hypothetical protein n=1 Tax=Aquimarina callyspongiae TaxID=3098150 RepID=UPI002AB34892|nr:hypothetical protein [Aquimarina sp. 2201CG5-10]MDY8138405.1 hypothetical protein [Aquimarina sp. 2201CG5-10]
MKKTILKTISVAILLVFMSSCETNDDNIQEVEGLTKKESNAAVNYESKSNKNPACWYIEKYLNGTVTYTQEGVFPDVGVTVVGVSNETCGKYIGWTATGSFTIVESNAQRVHAIRTSDEAGEISYVYEVGSLVIGTSTAIFKAIPPSIKCPESRDANIEQYYSSVSAKYYNQNYKYEWTIVDNIGTRYSTGRTAQLRRGRSSNVTLVVSNLDNTLCGTQIRTQNFYVDGRPGR